MFHEIHYFRIGLLTILMSSSPIIQTACSILVQESQRFTPAKKTKLTNKCFFQSKRIQLFQKVIFIVHKMLKLGWYSNIKAAVDKLVADISRHSFITVVLSTHLSQAEYSVLNSLEILPNSLNVISLTVFVTIVLLNLVNQIFFNFIW